MVDTVLPLHKWTHGDVWDRIHRSGVEYHWAYDAGMTRLSCSLCIMGSVADLVLAARLRPDLADEYALTEGEVRHDFKQGLPMSRIIRMARESEYMKPPPNAIQLPLMTL